MRKAHEEGGDFTSSECLASAFLSLAITKSSNDEADAETINRPENEPTTYLAALRSPQAREWKEAMRQEWHALVENHTFDVVQGTKGNAAHESTIDILWKSRSDASGSTEERSIRMDLLDTRHG